jgi:hypothetical protein
VQVSVLSRGVPPFLVATVRLNHSIQQWPCRGRSSRGPAAFESAERRREELVRADAVIAPLIGHSTCPWYRLPYGDGDARGR